MGGADSSVFLKALGYTALNKNKTGANYTVASLQKQLAATQQKLDKAQQRQLASAEKTCQKSLAQRRKANVNLAAQRLRLQTARSNNQLHPSGVTQRALDRALNAFNRATEGS